MSKDFSNPEGMSDVLIEESLKKTALQDRVQQYILSCGYNRIETPVLEYADLFGGISTQANEESMLKLIDRNGKVAVFRPDMTVPAARVVAGKLREYPRPLKLFYSGNVYRNDIHNSSRKREFSQIGVEIFGGPGVCYDAELLNLASGCLDRAGLKDYKIDIGHVGIFNGICSKADVPPDKRDRLKLLINRKNLVELEYEVSRLGVEDRYVEAICRLPSLFGNPEDIFEDLPGEILDYEAEEALDYLRKLFRVLKQTGMADKVMLDAGMTGSLNYYSGLIFKAYARGLNSVIASGGRYDNLLKEFSCDCPATGFAVYTDRLVRAASAQGIAGDKPYKVLIAYEESRLYEAFLAAEQYRRCGVTADMICTVDAAELENYGRQYGCNEIIRLEREGVMNA